MKKRLFSAILTIVIILSALSLAGCGNSSDDKNVMKIPLGSYSCRDEANKVTLYYSSAFAAEGIDDETGWYLYIPSADNEDIGMQFWVQSKSSSLMKWETAEEAKTWYEENFEVISSCWKNDNKATGTFIVSYIDRTDSEIVHADMIKIDDNSIYYAAVSCPAEEESVWYDTVRNEVFIVTDDVKIEVIK